MVLQLKKRYEDLKCASVLTVWNERDLESLSFLPSVPPPTPCNLYHSCVNAVKNHILPSLIFVWFTDPFLLCSPQMALNGIQLYVSLPHNWGGLTQLLPTNTQRSKALNETVF